MLKNQTYTFGPITYGFSRVSRKWEFKVTPKYTFLRAMKNGLESAHAVARQLAGAAKRAKNPEDPIDNMARAHIAKHCE
jgi:hypothetical protein